ncbi:hypothetical protein A4A49_09586 [Nicotiana attenuata]|uniref:Retrotransposon gag domain-containing protein n=1 Tax=Nicotiana attenuata TaxID=49451 RepID=A0A1J6I7H1_NICAT|nr:hypothetical protein A4A49_09586 [Nicotiana attenuata]
MTKGGKFVENSVAELGYLRELMQQLISTVGSLAGEVAHLKGLDQAVGELKEQMLNSTQKNTDGAICPSGSKSRSNRKDSSEKDHVEEEGNQTDDRQYSKCEAIEWHHAFMKYRSYTQPPTWTEYTTFERSLTKVNLSEENAISYFIGGLKEQFMKITNPRSLAQAFKASRIQEAYIDAQSKEIVQKISLSLAQTTNFKRNVDQRFQNKPLLAIPSPKKDPKPNSSGGFNRRRLSVEEANGKRAKRLCYFRTEKYVPGHKCKNLKQVYALEVKELPSTEYPEDAESSKDSEQIVELIKQTEHMEISVNALN